MIPFSTSRSLIHAVPPFGWAGLGGSNGATSSHSESSTYSVCIPTYYQVFTRLTVGCETASKDGAAGGLGASQRAVMLANRFFPGHEHEALKQANDAASL